MLYGEINRQRLKIINEHVVADTIDYLEARFAFSEDWDGLEKWVHFAKDGEVYDIRLTDNCVRKEDHLNLSAGIWKVYLHGNEFSGGKVIERITTNAAILKVEPTGTLDGEPFPELPASVTEQILARLENVEQNGGGSGGQQAQIDETLTKPGYAADAKAVGDALAEKLDADALGDAVEDALRQAKESGEFDGQPGAPGITPHIGENENWYIGDTDTGVKAQGEPGQDGITPHIGANGNWYIGDIDTGVKAQGEPGQDGKDGFSPVVSVSKIGKVTTITITDANGTKTATINDGADGSGGGDGSGGVNGADGIGIKSIVQTTKSDADDGVNVMTITLTDGSTYTFEVQNGSKGSRGEPGQPGADGKPGTTPQKGVDYWTESDKSEIVTDVLSALPTWEGGSY